jgi:exopolyphosphatase/pppGpp-phosphohydrolase
MVRKTVFQRIHLQQLLPSAALSSASKTKSSSRSFMQLQRSRFLGSEITNKPILATACSYHTSSMGTKSLKMVSPPCLTSVILRYNYCSPPWRKWLQEKVHKEEEEEEEAHCQA